MPVVTMTGTIASGAREVGELAARALDTWFVDQQLMVQAAQRCGVPVGVVEEHDERQAPFRTRLSAVLNAMLERSAVSGADPLTGATGLEAVLSQTYADMAREQETPFSDELYLETMTAIIRELAAGGQIVILGRGSQMILKDEATALHVLCIAPLELRSHRLAEREGMGMNEAKHRAKQSDRARAAFYRKSWKVDVEDPRLYDVVINTAKLDYEAAAEVVATAARLKAAG
jgi:cytidylate kinase